MRARTAFVLVTLCLGAVVLTATGGATSSQPIGQDQYGQFGTFQQGDIEADVFRMEVDLTASGDAEWRVIFRQTLEDETEVQGFEDLRADIEENPETYLDPFESRMSAIVSQASNETGREMELTNLSVETERDQRPQDEIGRVVFSFRWRGFATVENGTLSAGDALSGLPLDEDEVLQFSWPEGYELDSATPDPDTAEDHRVSWRGPLTFVGEEPRVAVAPAPDSSDDSSDGGTGGTDDGGTGDATDSDGTDGGSVADLATGPVVLGGVLLFLISIVAVTLVRQDGETEKTTDDAETTAEQPTAQTAATADLLSPEERVLKLLRENGGRMKQKEIAEEIGWSSARTSQVVGELREQGRVESFRLGRENVLTLPHVDIEGDDTPAGSDGGN